MPELVTHTSVAWLIARATKNRIRRLDPLIFIMGACLPDWLSHAFVVWGVTFDYLSLLHEPIPLFLASVLIASFAKPGVRSNFFANLYLGAASHYLLDLCQKHAFPSCRPLFPFSDYAVQLPLYSIEGSIYVMPFLVLAVLVVFLFDRRRISQSAH